MARVGSDDHDVPLLSLEGLVSQDNEEDVVVNNSALSRGDKRRNARLTRLRALVPVTNAVLGIDLADVKQVIVLTNHDSQVLARKRVKGKAWELGAVLDWAQRVATASGYCGVTVACEPTGHRWRVIEQLATQREMPFVCVNPMLVGKFRETEDYTRDKSDDKDAVLIARLVAQLHCYIPERPEENWARLRQLGARRERLITESVACIRQVHDLLDCAWPGVLDAAADPFGSQNWCAALAVVLQRCDGHPERLSRWSLARFEAAVVKELPRWGGSRRCRRIIEAVFSAVNDPNGVWVQRRGALERAHWVLQDWRATGERITQVQVQMLKVLDELELTELVTSIPGVSAIGAAAILAETGDPTRFDSPRALVKHAGLCPRENASGTFRGQSRISRRGRPGLRLAAWRAAWGAQHHNPVMAARYQYLTTRQHNRLTDGQARAALAAALLRWLHVIVTRRVTWDPRLAGTEVMPIAA
jgi:transposase